VIRLHLTTHASASAVVAAIEEIGVAYEVLRTDRGDGEPELEIGAVRIVGSAAILLWLGDRFPESRLFPPIGAPERAAVSTWVTWLANSVHTIGHRLDAVEGPTLTADVAATLRAAAATDRAAALDFIDDQLSGRRYVVGDRCTIADLLMHMLTEPRDGVDETSPQTRQALAAHRALMDAHPSVARMRVRISPV
jgi:glutathione S-transferase